VAFIRDPIKRNLPIWIGVGGTPESVIRAAEHGLPMALAIIGGLPARFTPYAQLYQNVYAKSACSRGNAAWY
jgi:alkanesulfonate monooxygenase SsuD/methylene tetrahydromethanopterin reductase-like flavin-dependent oxidoreductase (luciferase family)